MFLFDLFKKKAIYWEAYKNFLITECRIPFNTLLAIEKRSEDTIASLATATDKRIVLNDIAEDELMLLEMGLAAKASDQKYNVTLLAANSKQAQELQEALRLWQPQKSRIAVGTYQASAKGTDVCIDLFNNGTALQGNAFTIVGQ